MYKLVNDFFGNVTCIFRITDGASIPLSNDNSDYQAYLKFLAEGGQPLPADDNGQAS